MKFLHFFLFFGGQFWPSWIRIPNPHPKYCKYCSHPWTLSQLSGATVPRWQKFENLTNLEAFLIAHIQYVFLNPFKDVQALQTLGSGFPNRIRWNNWIWIRNTVSIAITNVSLNVVSTVRCHYPSLAKVLRTYKFWSFFVRTYTVYLLKPLQRTFRFFEHKIPSFFPLFGDTIDLHGSGSGSGFPNRIRWKDWIWIRNIESIAVTNVLSLNVVPTVRCHDPSLAVRKTALACLQIMLRVLGIYEGKRKSNLRFYGFFIKWFAYTELWWHVNAKSIPAVDWLTF